LQDNERDHRSEQDNATYDKKDGDPLPIHDLPPNVEKGSAQSDQGASIIHYSLDGLLHSIVGSTKVKADPEPG
jgi:hypothetical protein